MRLRHAAVFTALSLAIATLGGCYTPEGVLWTRSENGTVEIYVHVQPTAGREVLEVGRPQGRNQWNVGMAIQCDGRDKIGYCDLNYCNAIVSQKAEDGSNRDCKAPTEPDNRYHLRLEAKPGAGYRLTGWDIGPMWAPTGDPTLKFESPTPTTVDISWEPGAPERNLRYYVRPIFASADPPAPAPTLPDLSRCAGSPTEIVALRGPHADELLVLCSSIVLAKKDGSGSVLLANEGSKSVATDEAFAYFDGPGDTSGGRVVRRVSLEGGAATTVSPVSPLPIRWIGVDDTYAHYLGSGELGAGMYNAFKDGSPYGAPRTHAMYAETSVISATDDGASVVFAVPLDATHAKVLALPKGSDSTVIPSVVASSVLTPTSPLRHAGDQIYWGATLLEGSSSRAINGDIVRDGFIDGDAMFFTTASCLRRAVTTPGATPVDVSCTSAPAGPVVADANDVYWIRAGSIDRSAR